MDQATLIFLISTAVKIFTFTFVMILPIIAYSTYAERRVSSIIQDRVGPNRVGIPLTLFGFKKDIPFSGLLQPLADGLKALLKEDLVVQLKADTTTRARTVSVERRKSTHHRPWK